MFVKLCDNCGQKLGGVNSYVQTRGSVTDQKEPEAGRGSFRYLTDNFEEIHTFCDDTCDVEWRNKRRAQIPFKPSTK